VLDGLKYRSTGADIEFECAEIAVKEIKRLLEDE